jgi:hypothetical protein
MNATYVDEESLRFVIHSSKREITCQLMFLMKNLTWKDWNWYLKLLYTWSEKRKGVGEPWLDVNKIETRILNLKTNLFFKLERLMQRVL